MTSNVKCPIGDWPPLRNVQVIRRTSASFWFPAADRFAVALFETLLIDCGWDGKAP